jgi:hypothetical protein
MRKWRHGSKIRNRRRDWSTSRPCLLTPGETAPSTKCIGGSAGPRTNQDVKEIKKFLTLSRIELQLVSHLARSLLTIPPEPSGFKKYKIFVLLHVYET